MRALQVWEREDATATQGVKTTRRITCLTKSKKDVEAEAWTSKGLVAESGHENRRSFLRARAVRESLVELNNWVDGSKEEKLRKDGTQSLAEQPSFFTDGQAGSSFWAKKCIVGRLPRGCSGAWEPEALSVLETLWAPGATGRRRALGRRHGKRRELPASSSLAHSGSTRENVSGLTLCPRSVTLVTRRSGPLGVLSGLTACPRSVTLVTLCERACSSRLERPTRSTALWGV